MPNRSTVSNRVERDATFSQTDQIARMLFGEV